MFTPQEKKIIDRLVLGKSNKVIAHELEVKEATIRYKYSNSNYRYGFSSVRKLKRWFDPEDRRNLKRHDFVIRVYAVPDYIVESPTQVIFKFPDAKWKKTLEIC